MLTDAGIRADGSFLPADADMSFDGGGEVSDAGMETSDGSVGSGRACVLGEPVVVTLADFLVRMTDAPALAVRNEGAVVLWVAQRDGHAQLQSRFVPTDPDALTGVFTVTATMTTQRDPVAVATREGFVVVWREDGDGDFELFSRAVDAEGVAIDDEPTRLTTNDVDDGPPGLAVGQGGVALMAWTEGRDGVATTGRVRPLDDSGAPMGEAVELEALARALGAPSVVALRDNFGVAWRDDANDVMLQTFDGRGVSRGPATPMSGEGNASGAVSLAANADGGGAVLFDVRVAGTRAEVRFRPFDADGSPSRSESPITVGDVTGTASSLASLGSPWVAAFRATTDTSSQMRVAVLDFEGAPMNGVDLGAVAPPSTQTVVRATPDGTAVFVAWTDSSRMWLGRIPCVP